MLVNLSNSSCVTVVGAASMVSGTTPVRTTISHAMKNVATLRMGSSFSASGVLTTTSRYAVMRASGVGG
ncbi:hypothetical protein [Nitratidesulfovibrio liaohensis]|uniref:Uncharacterized protein n=1 Tax=Nitratidesulfovibrio liaohensis TaxID=2604158 RepID=A0ABY9R3B5_9BACT|nr:hypothetical protein [Nitratidesulfovibrio liaohensis]WMW66092.1 hypothetical protein KPS_000640 [Nitratidesulfovibrio liaohensis]